MELKLINRPHKYYAEFYIDGVTVEFLNALRRAILVEVPTLAIHEVYIHMNNSVLYDEELALRLSLIPLKADPKDVDILGKCRDIEKMDLSQLTECTARLRLKKKNNTDKIITIYSGEIEPIDKKSVRPVYDKIPIVKLGPGQEIDVEMIAKVGKGKDHAKWMPVSSLGYKPIPSIVVRDSTNCKDCDACIKACPKGILKKKDDKPVLEGVALYLCDLDRICVRSCPNRVLSLETSDSQFIFRIESVGQHDIEDIIIAALDILSSKYLDLSKELQRLVGELKKA